MGGKRPLVCSSVSSSDVPKKLVLAVDNTKNQTQTDWADSSYHAVSAPDFRQTAKQTQSAQLQQADLIPAHRSEDLEVFCNVLKSGSKNWPQMVEETRWGKEKIKKVGQLGVKLNLIHKEPNKPFELV